MEFSFKNKKRGLSNNFFDSAPKKIVNTEDKKKEEYIESLINEKKKEVPKTAEEKELEKWNYSSDEDEFYDRTGDAETFKKKLDTKTSNPKTKSSSKGGAETYSSLKAKKTVLEAQKQLILKKMDDISKKKQTKQKEDDDPLDSYMSSLVHEDQKEKMQKLVLLIADIEKEESRLNRLMELSQSALDRFSITHPNTNEIENKKKSSQNSSSSSSSSLPSPPSSSSSSSSSRSERKKEAISSNRIGLTKYLSEFKPETGQDDSDDSAPPQQSVEEPLKKKRKKSKKKSEEKEKSKESKLNYDGEVDYDEWVPPVGQTGDGRTHLNEKFGY